MPGEPPRPFRQHLINPASTSGGKGSRAMLRMWETEALQQVFPRPQLEEGFEGRRAADPLGGGWGLRPHCGGSCSALGSQPLRLCRSWQSWQCSSQHL